MLAHGVTLFALSIAGIVRAGNTTCKTTSLDWFTQSVGETPCRVYERLRQNCSPGYQVPSMGASPPGDVCNDQVSTCCCNSVAFSLLMMCMNCQYGIGSSINGDTGFDAAAGTYDLYLGRCGPSTNGSLPNITQEAVCKQNLNIPKFMYQPFWGDGAWFYEYTKGTAQLQISSGNNDTGLCPKSTASASVTPSSTAGAGGSTASASALPSQSSTNVGAIAGGVVGGVVLLALATLAGFFVARRRKQRGIVDLTEETKTPEATFEPFQMPPGGPTHNSTSNLHLHDYELTGLMHAVAPAPYAAPSSSGWTSTYASSSAPTSTAPPSRSKPGLIATSPPTRAEIYESQSQFSPPGTMSHSSGPDRHEDSEELSTAYGLGRSASGRLPPSYRPR